MPARPTPPDEGGRRRLGRPRLDSRPVVGDPTDEILGTAARLFGEVGVNNTTMSRLAAEVGLKQSSLYYYFRSRDDVVAALMDRANVVPLALVEGVTAADDPEPVQLFRFVRGDVEALCALPFDINEVHRIAARDPERFASYWTDRRRLEKRLAALLRAGAAAGTLRKVDPRTTALTIMANDEGVQNWFRLGGSTPSATKVATGLAELTVGGLLPDGGRLAEVARAAHEADRRAPAAAGRRP